MEKEISDILADDLTGEPDMAGLPEEPLAANPAGGHTEPSPALVREALKGILESEVFRSSKRGSQFLRFVVQYRLEGHAEPLKERTIGAALFNRPLDYSTGDDSVVRAQAREVRRRLEKYYVACPSDTPVHIELPVGSYTPEFKWTVPPEAEHAVATSLSAPLPPALFEPAKPLPTIIPPPSSNRGKAIVRVIGSTVLCLLMVLIAWKLTHSKAPDSAISEFWSPVLGSGKPLLICLPKPIFYRPSPEVYKRTAKSPGEFDREVDRMTHTPHLGPDDTVRWGDMIRYFDYGVSQGDVEAAIRVSNFLGRQGVASEVRIGDGYSAADMRNSPAVVIGAFSNPLTMETIAGLHFTFVDDDKGIRIQEQGASGRSWYSQHGRIGEDYGLVTRLLDSGTGQFLVLVAGIEASGSDAAADLVVHPAELEKALRDSSKEWPGKNLQIVVSTAVKDGIAGPPRVVAVYTW